MFFITVKRDQVSGIGDQGNQEGSVTPKSYRDLDVWQKAMDLVVICYHMTKRFPKSEIYGLASQLNVRPFQYRQILRKVVSANTARNFSTIFQLHTALLQRLKPMSRSPDG